LDGQSYLIIPRRNLWLLSTKAMEQFLLKKISSHLSIESVTVQKIYQHDVQITIAERTPVAIWSNGTRYGTIDRRGVLIEFQNQPTRDLPIVQDELATDFKPDQHLLEPAVVEALIKINDLLRAANLPVQTIIIPKPTCPLPPPPEETLTSPTNANGNTNGANTNQPPLNVNVAPENVNQPIPVVSCDLAALRPTSQEIHAQLKDGPRVLFDRHENLPRAVETLGRILGEPQNAHVTYVDVRFEERVFVK
jgi:hypothetical protein